MVYRGTFFRDLIPGSSKGVPQAGFWTQIWVRDRLQDRPWAPAGLRDRGRGPGTEAGLGAGLGPIGGVGSEMGPTGLYETKTAVLVKNAS